MNEANIDYWKKTLNNPPRSYKALFAREQKYLRDSIKEGESVLDIGCGDGRSILSIIDITKNIVGVDIDKSAVADTKETLKQYPEIRVEQGDVTNLPFASGVYDVVIFLMTLVNLGDKKGEALQEMKRVMKNNGKVILSVYSEKALEERRKMYSQVSVPILSEIDGKFIFDKDGFMSEQFSMSDFTKMVESIGLFIVDFEEVENLAYIFTLKKTMDENRLKALPKQDGGKVSEL